MNKSMIAMFVTLTFIITVSSTSLPGQELGRSQIVEVKDAQAQFFGTVDEIRLIFERVAQMSPALQAAKKAAEDLAKDPDNPVLKRKMIEARRRAMAEKAAILKLAIELHMQLDKHFQNLGKQFDGQISDAEASRLEQGVAESDQSAFLQKSRDELLQFEKLLPMLNEQLVSTNPAAALKLSAEERRVISDFKNQIKLSLPQLRLAQDATDLQTRRVAVLTELKLKATEEYLDIKRAISDARSDLIVFHGLAKNDSTYLKLLENEELLQDMASRPKVKHRSSIDDFWKQDGYRFGPLAGNEPHDDSSSAEVRTLIDEIGTSVRPPHNN